MRRGWRDIARVAAPVVIALLLIGTTAAVANLRLNVSHSMPVGLWRAIPMGSQAEYVEICPPPGWRSLMQDRGYSGAGPCDGLSPLVKPIVAKAGDLIELSNELVRVNGVEIEASITLTHDALGRAIDAYPRGSYRVTPDEIWVISTHHARSLDSRYFGPLRRVDVRVALEPLLVW